MKKQLLLSFAWLVCQTASIHASTILIGNLSNYTNDTNLVAYKANTTSVGKAIGFTMGATDYNLDSVTLRLFMGSGAVPLVELWSGTTTSITGTSALLTLTNPGTLPAAYTNDVFTAPTTFTLTAGSTYYVVLRETSGNGNVLWSFDGTAATTGQPGVSTVQRLIGSSSAVLPSAWTTASGVNNWFEIGVSAVPEPSALGLFGIGGVLLSLYRRRLVSC